MERVRGLRLKAVGLYFIAILVVIRFILLPLNSNVKNRETLLNEHIETYTTKAALLQKQGSADAGRVQASPEEEKRVIESLYPVSYQYAVIQAEMLTALMKEAEKDGLSVSNFEMSEISSGEILSEVPVVLRLSGNAKDMLKYLKQLDRMPKKTDIKTIEISRNGDQYNFTLTFTAYRVEK